jgi:hypothetical protein
MLQDPHDEPPYTSDAHLQRLVTGIPSAVTQMKLVCTQRIETEAAEINARVMAMMMHRQSQTNKSSSSSSSSSNQRKRKHKNHHEADETTAVVVLADNDDATQSHATQPHQQQPSSLTSPHQPNKEQLFLLREKASRLMRLAVLLRNYEASGAQLVSELLSPTTTTTKTTQPVHPKRKTNHTSTNEFKNNDNDNVGWSVTTGLLLQRHYDIRLELLSELAASAHDHHCKDDEDNNGSHGTNNNKNYAGSG